MKALYIFSFIVLLASNSFAGDELCNGGVSVQCGSSYHMLDLIEAGPLYGLHFEYPASMTRWEILQKVLKAPAIRNSDFGLFLAKYMVNFESEVRFVSDAEIMPTNDEGSFLLPNGCQKKVQAAIQFRDPMPFVGKRYVISKQVWDNMSEQDRAGLMLHEFILRYLMHWPPWNKSLFPIRYMTALALSKEFQDPQSTLLIRSFDDLLPQIPYTQLPNY
ncbi:hypothetical protein D3C72_1622800 [compost metagenome]